MELTDNLNIKQFRSLIIPKKFKDEFSETDHVAQLVADSRNIIQDILTNQDERRMVIVGPCSLHDCKATLEYAERLRRLQTATFGFPKRCRANTSRQSTNCRRYAGEFSK